MKIFERLNYKGFKITILESTSIKGYQFKCLVNNISLGCLPTKNIAKQEGIKFIDNIVKSKKRGKL